MRPSESSLHGHRTDKHGRTGEYKPFEVQASQLTIVE